MKLRPNSDIINQYFSGAHERPDGVLNAAEAVYLQALVATKLQAELGRAAAFSEKNPGERFHVHILCNCSVFTRLLILASPPNSREDSSPAAPFQKIQLITI